LQQFKAANSVILSNQFGATETHSSKCLTSCHILGQYIAGVNTGDTTEMEETALMSDDQDSLRLKLQ